MNINEVKIVNLKDEDKYLEQVSKWMWKEWSEKHGAKLEDVIYRSRHSLNNEGIPQMFIAKYKDEIIGVVSLWRNDLISRQDLFPWLSTLFVKEEYRNKGIGRKLQQKCIDEVKKMQYKYLYLITDYENYYEKMGWEFMELAPSLDGRYKRIYRHKL